MIFTQIIISFDCICKKFDLIRNVISSLNLQISTTKWDFKN